MVSSYTDPHDAGSSITLQRLSMFKMPRSMPLRGRSHATIEIFTRDGEVFPVKRKLLRPCIHLTQAVRSDIPSVTIAVDTLVFDRCSDLLLNPSTEHCMPIINIPVHKWISCSCRLLFHASVLKDLKSGHALTGCSYSWRPVQQGNLHQTLQCIFWATCCRQGKCSVCNLCRCRLHLDFWSQKLAIWVNEWKARFQPSRLGAFERLQYITQKWAKLHTMLTGGHQCPRLTAMIDICCRITAVPSLAGWTRAFRHAASRRWRPTTLLASAGSSWMVRLPAPCPHN